MDDKTAEELLTWLVKNHETESPFLTPYQRSSVELVSLLDKIADLRGIDRKENGRQYNKIADKLKKET